MHTCPITVAPVSLMSPSQHHARILLIRKCSRSLSPNGCQTNSMPKFTHSITRRPFLIDSSIEPDRIPPMIGCKHLPSSAFEVLPAKNFQHWRIHHRFENHQW